MTVPFRPHPIISHILLGLCLLFGVGMAAPVNAAYPCTGAPGEQQVGVTTSGGATVPLCVAGSGPAPAPAAPLVDYANIAWHPDYDDVWFGGGWSQSGRSEQEVLALCNRETGGGCSSIGEYYNSYLAIVRSGDGYLHYGWGQSGNAAKKEAKASCAKARGAQAQRLACEERGVYNALTRKYITPKNLALSRKLYASGAWVAGTAKYDGRAWLASGHRSMQAAIDAAIGACQAANPAAKCEAFSGTGNGFIQLFRSDQGKGDTIDDRAINETTPKRAAEAARAACAEKKMKCILQAQFDSRRPGLFVHNFRTGISTP